jgi:predicted dehydrogenase
LKAVVIGVGRMGQRHMQVIQSLGLQLVGICDANPETLALAGREHGISEDQRFVNASTMLELTQPDCVIVATTSPTHCEYTCLAAEAGARYIFCEKPMAVSLAECDRMIDTCRRKGSKLAINHQMRFMQQYTEPKRIALSEAFGGLSSITVVAGNFGMAMNGTHYVEMFRYMTDEAPEEATAWFSKERIPNPRGPQFEDRAGAIRLSTAKGRRFYMEIGADQGHGMKVIYSGPYGQLVVDELAGTMYLAVRKEEHRHLPSTRYGMPWNESVIKILPADSIGPSRSVLDALLNDKNPPTGEDGRLAVAALIAAYVSDENGHIPVKIDDASLPVDRVFPWA